MFPQFLTDLVLPGHFIPCYVSCVMCHVSRVMCHLSHVKIYFFYILYIFFYPLKKMDRVVELVGGGSVINGAYPV